MSELSTEFGWDRRTEGETAQGVYEFSDIPRHDIILEAWEDTLEPYLDDEPGNA